MGRKVEIDEEVLKQLIARSNAADDLMRGFGFNPSGVRETLDISYRIGRVLSAVISAFLAVVSLYLLGEFFSGNASPDALILVGLFSMFALFFGLYSHVIGRIRARGDASERP